MLVRSLVALLAVVPVLTLAASNRPSWVVNEIYSFNHPYAAQASGELATKMQKMASSPFYFYRGTAHVFFKDMNTLPASSQTSSATAYTWLEGDMHIANFGGFRDNNGTAVFDVTDFDEGYLGQYVWDVRRMATSIVLSARENGLSDANATQLVQTMVDSYLNKLGDFKGTSAELTYSLVSSNTSGVVQDTVKAADGKSRSSFLDKYTTVSGSTRSFKTDSSLLKVSSSVYTSIQNALPNYVQSIASSKRYSNSYYNLKDIRQKLGSGTGSLGRFRYYLLLEGPSSSTSDDVIIEMKQSVTSAVALAAPGRLPAANYGNNEAARVAMTMKAQLANVDKLVGYTTLGSVPYFLREKSPYAEDFDPALLTSLGKFDTAAGYFGKALAKVHALADKDYDSFINPFSQDKEISDAATPSGLKAEIVSFALDYANQVKLDWQAFVNAYKAGTPLY